MEHVRVKRIKEAPDVNVFIWEPVELAWSVVYVSKDLTR